MLFYAEKIVADKKLKEQRAEDQKRVAECQAQRISAGEGSTGKPSWAAVIC